MKFIFPQNYQFHTKILGLIDYKTAIFDVIWGGIIFEIINLLFSSFNLKIFIFIVFVFPVLIFSIIGVNGESFINLGIYIIKFSIRQKLLFYDK